MKLLNVFCQQSRHMSCKVSVVIAVYKVEQYIAQCAESLFSQTWKDMEFVFVDNNTPDDSMKILEETLRKFPERKNQTIMMQEKQQGLGPVRISGSRMTTGDYVIHVDSDDWVEPDFIEKLVSMALTEDADVVYCDYFKEYEGKHARTKTGFQPDLPDTDGITALYAIHRGQIKAFMCNKLVRRTLYDFDTIVTPICNMHEDIVIQTQLLYRARKVVHVPLPLYHYRRRRAGAVTAGSVLRNRKKSAVGLFHLYNSLPDTASPLDYIRYDLATRAGWYSVCSLDSSVLRDNPEAVRYLSGISVEKGHRVSPFGLWITRMICRVLNGKISG